MIRAATLPGGSNNQDRYITGDGFAAVLDGATSFAGNRSHDPGWYAEQLAQAIGERVPRGGSLANAVTEAIGAVSDAHGLSSETTPTSTVALARWSAESIETYVLGDSYAVVLRTDGTEGVRTDDRLGSVAMDERAAYRNRLAGGGGYGRGHRELLLKLQAEQARQSNRPGGYWIAGAEPEAGGQGFTATEDRPGVAAIVLASDGVALERYSADATWSGLYRDAAQHGAGRVLRSIHEAELTDPDGKRWPRSKVHDDKTLVVVKLG